VRIQGTGGSPYQGEDRRQRGASGAARATGERNALIIAVGVLLFVAALSATAPLLLPGADSELASGIQPLLDAAAVAVAVLIGVLCFVRWRLVGQACSLWFVGAMLTYGLVTVAVGHLVPVVMADGTEPQVLRYLHPASRLVFLALMVTALVRPEVDARLQPWRVFVAVIAGVAGITVLFQLLPSLGRVLAGANDGIAQELAFPYGSVLLVTLYCAVAMGHFTRSRHGSQRIYSWFGVLLLALAAAEAHRLLPVGQLGVWGLGDVVLRLAGLLAAVTGATRDLVFTYGEQGGRLLESVATGATAQARIRAGQAENEERAHEARNALAAIEGATKTLEHYRDRLDPEMRASLTNAISAEIARLQGLVSVERSKGRLEPFAVERALRHIVASARAADVEVTTDIDPSVSALGRAAETAEVVQNLIVNARRYAPGSPVLLEARYEDGGVLIRVNDRGPGVEEGERRLIFTRGTRGRASDRTAGSGLGLYVSLELMREQSGDLWVEERPGGGASFALWLPSADHAGDAQHQPAADEHAGQR
jgi:signal transduction histidine kinase